MHTCAVTASLESSVLMGLIYSSSASSFPAKWKGGHVQVLQYKVKYWKILIADS